jgi:hypothetical protein
MRNRIIMLAVVVVVSLLLSISQSYSVDNKAPLIKKQPEIQQVKPKKSVRIKLKRTAEGKYTWDLTGDDVDEIVRADKRLRKQLITE